MGFIPKKIKAVFTRKSKKKEPEALDPEAIAEAQRKVAEAAAAAEAARIAEEQRAAQERRNAYHTKRQGNIEHLRSDEGVYSLDLDIGYTGIDGHGKKMLMISNQDARFTRIFSGHRTLASTKALAMELEEHMREEYGVKAGHVYFKLKDQKFFIHANDDFLGLPPGQPYQAVIVPEGVKWKPPVFVPGARKAAAGTSPMLEPPTLPPYLRANPNNPLSPPKPR